MTYTKKQTPQSPVENINYKLHLAQQAEYFNRTLDNLKNNVYGLSQVLLVINGLEAGLDVESAAVRSLEIIDTLNATNAEAVQKKLDAQKAEEQLPVVEVQAEQPVVEVQAERTAEVVYQA